MAYIYKITNIQNGKVYIGKTEYSSIEKRFMQHKNDRFRYPERPLYKAMNKYGLDNFKFEIIEETDSPEEREIYWISFYNSYGNKGYNATLGGDGKKYLDYDKILKDYKENQNMTEVAKKNKCSVDSVRNVLQLNNVEILNGGVVGAVKNGKKVIMIDKTTNEELKEFKTQRDAAKFLQENLLSNTSDAKSLAAKIGKVCKGERKTCAGFKWKYSVHDGVPF